jgi:hypothetical protein
MVVGYFFEAVLGLIFAIGLSGKGPLLAKKPLTRNTKLLATGCKTFFDCAVFFVASIEIACLIVLERKNSGISANALGGLTVQITWAVALLCLLPLLYPMVILEYVEKGRSNYRFFLFCGCWILFFYTFVSQMIGNFGQSQVGQGAGPGRTTIITTEEMDVLTSLCLSGVKVLTNTEQKILSGFGAAGSIVISLYGLLYLLWFIIQRQSRRQAKWVCTKAQSIPARYRSSTFLIRSAVVLVPILTIPQFWALMRLRGIQKALANSTSNSYTDNQWTFGQVVAVIIFAPVFTEVGYLWIQDRGDVTNT